MIDYCIVHETWNDVFFLGPPSAGVVCGGWGRVLAFLPLLVHFIRYIYILFIHTMWSYVHSISDEAKRESLGVPPPAPLSRNPDVPTASPPSPSQIPWESSWPLANAENHLVLTKKNTYTPTMLISKKNRTAVYKFLFSEGVCYA